MMLLPMVTSADDAVKVGDIIVPTFLLLVPLDVLDAVNGFAEAYEGGKENNDRGTCSKHVPQATSEFVFGLVAEHAGHPSGSLPDEIVFFHSLYVVFKMLKMKMLLVCLATMQSLISKYLANGSSSAPPSS